MASNEQRTLGSNTPQFAAFDARARLALSCALLLALVQPLVATENAPRKPFAQWADLPAPRQFVISLWYMESEAYHIWTGRQRVDVNNPQHGEDYGIDKMNGILMLQYGLSRKWAADLNLGVTTTGTRSFNPNGSSESTTGLMDTSLGVRYQIFNEAEATSRWLPTLTFRAGAVLPGSYDEDFPFAPGNHSAAIEPSLLVKKHFAWPGLGAYGDFLYRWMRTSGDDQYLAAVGLFQEIKGWTLNVGYRHQQALSGYDLTWNGVGQPLEYSPQVREISDAIEAGFSYTTPNRHIKYGFHLRKIFDGSNTDSAFWLGGYIDFPFGGKSTP